MRSLIRCVCVLVCASLVVAADESAFDAAVTAFQNHDYETAAARLEELIEESPTWAPGHVLLGQCYYALGEPERAQRSIDRAVELDPQTDLFKAWYGAAQELIGQGRYAWAIAPIEKAVESAPEAKRKATSFRLAYCYLRAGQYENAQRSFEAWQSRYGTTGDSSYYLALTCQNRQDHVCALNALRVAQQNGPTEDRSRMTTEYLSKWSYQWATHPDNKSNRDKLMIQAIEDTRPWYDAEPENPVALRYHVESLLGADRGPAVVEMLSLLLKADPSRCTARTLLARAFNALGEGANAERQAAEAVRCDPTSAEPYIEIAVSQIRQLRPVHTEVDQVRQDQQRLREAITAIKTARELEPDLGSRAETLLADATESLERLRQVEAEFVEIQNTHSNDLQKAREEEIRLRCQAIRWNMEHDPQRVTPEDEVFYSENDCKP